MLLDALEVTPDSQVALLITWMEEAAYQYIAGVAKKYLPVFLS